MHRQAVGAGGEEIRHEALGPLDEQVNLQNQVRGHPEASNDRRTNGNFTCEVAIRDVNVHKARARRLDGFQRLTHPGEVPRKQ